MAISGFYNKVDFKIIGLVESRPVVFDDTIYFLPFWSQQEATFFGEILSSNTAKECLSSIIFWGNKRPITIDLLKRLNLKALAAELGREEEYQFYANRRLL